LLIKQSKKNRRVLGVDCGLASVGWEILEFAGNRYVHIAGGVVETDKNRVTQMRLREIYETLDKIIKEFKPEDIAIEEIFFFKNNKTVIGVSEARGVIMLAGSMNNLNVFGYTPLEVKIAVTGYGRSEKKQVQYMVQRLVNLKELPKSDDWADAIAIAICHLNSTNYQDRKNDR